MTTYNITPVAKPRMTRKDKWAQRPCVMKYRAFADECRAAGLTLSDPIDITFIIPMPDSWAQKKRVAHYREPHRQTPDIDNLLKAVMDAVMKQDCAISSVKANKIWGERGQIVVRP